MGLLEFLQREKDARLIFGKRELQIIRKQLLGEPLKQSERNRLSKFIRPKLRFIRSCSTFADEFELKRKNTLKTLIERAVKLIQKDAVGKKAVAILLFGSRAENTSNFRSDIDICAVFDWEISQREAAEFQIRIMSELPDIVDVKVLNVLPKEIKANIVKNYKILFKKRGLRKKRLENTMRL